MKLLIKDFLLFRRMLTPILLQIVFWLGVLACLITAVIDFSHHHWTDGLLALLLGPILVRVASEILILLFSIHELLNTIKNKSG